MKNDIYADVKIIPSAKIIPKGKVCLRPAALRDWPPDAEEMLSEMIIEIEGKTYSIQWDSMTPLPSRVSR